MRDAQRTPEELRQSLERIVVRVKEVKAAKKNAAAAYNDELKDLDMEINAILEQLGPQ